MMKRNEEIIKAMECCTMRLNSIHGCGICPRQLKYSYDCEIRLMKDALDMLKENGKEFLKND